jgi:hypothetical protein
MAFLLFKGDVMFNLDLEQLYEQLKLVANDIEFAKQNFINSNRSKGSKSYKILVEKLSRKCDELKNQDLEILKFIYELLECEDESDLEAVFSVE